MRPEAVATLLRRCAGGVVSGLSATLACRSAVTAMSGVEIPTFVALAGHGRFVNVSGQSAGAK